MKKTGECQIGLIGFPSVGKSTLMSKITGTYSKVAEYEFTTLTCIPGNFTYNGAKFQLLDLPGIIEGAKDNKGRGRQVIAVTRQSDLIMIILDATRPLMHKSVIEKELEGFGIRLNKTKPKILINKRDKGGVQIQVQTNKQLQVSENTIREIMKEYKLSNAEVVIQEEVNEEDIIDIIEGNRRYIPCIYILNKIDCIPYEELVIWDRVPYFVPISAKLEWNFDEIYEEIWNQLNLIRIYTKPKGESPDFEAPVILRKGRTSVLDFCNNIHKQIIKSFKYSYVWGLSAKHNP